MGGLVIYMDVFCVGTLLSLFRLLTNMAQSFRDPTNVCSLEVVLTPLLLVICVFFRTLFLCLESLPRWYACACLHPISTNTNKYLRIRICVHKYVFVQRFLILFLRHSTANSMCKCSCGVTFPNTFSKLKAQIWHFFSHCNLAKEMFELWVLSLKRVFGNATSKGYAVWDGYDE